VSRYEEAFEWMAQRGQPAGAAVVVQRVRAELADAAGTELVTLVGQREDHERGARFGYLLSGPVVAAWVFLVVVAVGAVFWAVRGNGTDVVQPDAAGVTWAPATGERTGRLLTAGPGGFVRADFGIPVVHFSVDGAAWEDIELPEADGFVVSQALVSTDAGWLVVAVDTGDATIAWTSADGRSWTKIELPDELQRNHVDVVSGTSGYLALTRVEFGATADQLWWSTDGVIWGLLAPSGLPETMPDTIEGHASGFIGWDSASAVPIGDSLTVYTSVDGVDWVSGQLTVDGDRYSSFVEWQLFASETAGDVWLVTGAARVTETEAVTLAWTSSNGTSWNQQPTPAFDGEDNLANNLLILLSTGSDFVALVGESELAVYEDGFRYSQSSTGSAQVWLSRNGTDWTPGQRFEKGVTDAAIALIDGEPVGLWYPSPPALGTAPVPTSVTSPPVEDLDERGVALQDEILSDGTVTQEELESAVAGMAACMESHGLTDVTWSVDPDGKGWSSGYAETFGDDADQEISDYCFFSYVDRLLS